MSYEIVTKKEKKFYDFWLFFTLLSIQKPFYNHLITVFIPTSLQGIINYLPFFICTICLLYYLILLRGKISSKLVLITIGFILFQVFLINDWKYSKDNTIIIYSFFSLIIFISLSCINFYRSFFLMAKKFFIFNFLCVPLVLYLFFNQLFLNIQFDYMLLGQGLVPICIYFLFLWRYEQKKYAIWIFLSLFIVILLFANRGSFLWTFLAFCYLFLNIKISQKIKIALFCICICLLLYNLFSIYNVDMSFSRNVKKFLEHSATTDSGRSSYYEIAKKQISDNPFFGIGIYNSRKVLFEELRLMTLPAGYPHNLFFEIFMQFGLVIPLIFIFLLILDIKVKIATTNFENTGLFFYIIFAFFMRLMLSGSYLIDFSVPFLLAFLCNRSLSKQEE